MKEVRVYKTINYWVDVEVDENSDIDEAIDEAMKLDMCNWESEVVDEGILED